MTRDPFEVNRRKAKSTPVGAWLDSLEQPTPTPAERLEYLRGELRGERISWGELAELQSLADHIDADDLELREAAGLPEFPPERPHVWQTGRMTGAVTCSRCGLLPLDADDTYSECDPGERCPACGSPIDYCQGHGETGDAYGAAILADHDDGRHDRCHSSAGCDLEVTS
jgi:hypothetical protein